MSNPVSRQQTTTLFQIHGRCPTSVRSLVLFLFFSSAQPSIFLAAFRSKTNIAKVSDNLVVVVVVFARPLSTLRGLMHVSVAPPPRVSLIEGGGGGGPGGNVSLPLAILSSLICLFFFCARYSSGGCRVVRVVARRARRSFARMFGCFHEAVSVLTLRCSFIRLLKGS